MKPAGLKSYDKRTKKAVFECIVPGTRSRKRKRKVIMVTGWDDLLEQLKIFRESIQHPERYIVVPGDVPTLRTYIGTAWASLTSRLSPRKRRNQEAVLHHHLLPFLGHVRLDHVTIAHLDDLVSMLQRKTYGRAQQPYSNSTINTCLHLLRSILKHAWRRRILSDYPLREKLPLLPEPVVQNELTMTRARRVPDQLREQRRIPRALHHDRTRKTRPQTPATQRRERLRHVRLRALPLEQAPLHPRPLHRPPPVGPPASEVEQRRPPGRRHPPRDA